MSHKRMTSLFVIAVSIGCLHCDAPSVHPINDQELAAELSILLTSAGSESRDVEAFWFFTTDTCLKCQNVDHALRALENEYKSAWSLRAVHIGALADTAFSAGFLRRFGIRADMLVLPYDTFEARFGRAVPDPSFIVLTAGKTRIFDASAGGEVAKMVSYVETLLQGSITE